MSDRYQERLQKLEEMHAAVAVARGTIDQCLRIAETLDGDQDVVLSINPRNKGAAKEFPMTLDRPVRAILAAEIRQMAVRIELETIEVERELAAALGLPDEPPQEPPIAA